MTLNKATELFLNKGKGIPYNKKFSSGFPKLDELLNGGFSSGLHCIGATPSLGKSTFVLQMAENFAKEKNEVIVFSLEMSTLNLAAKAISRELFRQNEGHSKYCKTADELTRKEKIKNYTDAEWAAIEKASLTLTPINTHITIIECEKEPCTVRFIEEELKKREIKNKENKPVIIIDYLQILAPVKQGLTDKQSVDMNLEQLKFIAKAYDIPVILISSFNRDGYDTGVSLKSFKDSGNIEYTCDTIIGMQYAGTGKPNFSADKARKQNPRKIDVVILKQRNGQSGYSIEYNFYSRNNFFKEIKKTEKEHITNVTDSNNEITYKIHYDN